MSQSKLLEEVSKKIEQLLDDNEISVEKRISFPRYKILPVEVRLALAVLNNHGMEVTLVFKEKLPKE